MGSSQDQVTRLIVISTWGSAVWGAGALSLGLILSSQTIIYDGLYCLVTMTLSVIALGAVRAIRRGPDDRHPFGRQAFEPMSNMVKAVGLGGLSIYAITNAALTLAAGGNDVDYRWGFAYSVTATLGATGLTLFLRRRQRDVSSGLVSGEVSKWIMNTANTAGIAVAFGIGLALQRSGSSEVAAYIDPAVVLLVSAISFFLPLRMGVQSFRELVVESPPSAIADEVHRRVIELGNDHQLGQPFIRAGKVGEQLSVQVYYLVGADAPGRDMATYDEYRRELESSLNELGFDLWLTVCFTADSEFATDPIS